MGQNKEELKKLLSFIAALTEQPGNEEFVAGLRALVSETAQPELKAELEDIRRILNIRGKQSIDYTFVDDELTRHQLIMDNLRMENAYLDTSLSIEDKWYEYCSYIHFQVENILNFYFTKAFASFELAQRYIEKYTKDAPGPYVRDEKKHDSSEISTYCKTTAFCNDFFPFAPGAPDFTSTTLSKIRVVRNEYVHRSAVTVEKEGEKIKELQKSTSLGALKATLIKLVGCVKSQFQTKSFINIVPAVVEKKLPGAATIKFNDKVVMLDNNTLTRHSQILVEGKSLKAIVRNNVLLDVIVEA